MIARAELQEALSLERLLRGLVEEYDDDERHPVLDATGSVITFAFIWLLPIAAPVLAWRGEIGLALLAAAFGVFFPAVFRSSSRSERDEELRLYGPSREAVWLARLIEQLPWLAWASLASAAIPLAYARHHGADLTGWVVAVAVLSAALPLVRLTLGEGGAILRRPRRWLESTATLLFAVTLALFYGRWDPASPAPLDSTLRIMLPLTVAWTALAFASRGARRLMPRATWGLAEEDVETSAAFEPVDMGVPDVHEPARSPIAIELRLARLSLEHRWRASRSAWVKVTLAFSLLMAAVFPALVGLLGVVVLVDSGPDGERAPVSLIGLWAALVFLGASRPLSADDWMRGLDWRSQLGLSWLHWLTLSLIPAAIGCAWALGVTGTTEQSVALAALVLAGCALRHHFAGVTWLVPSVSDERRWARAVAVGVGVAIGLGMVGLPVAHVFEFRVPPHVALRIAGGAALLALLGAASDLFLRTEDALSEEFADDLEALDDDDEDDE